MPGNYLTHAPEPDPDKLKGSGLQRMIIWISLSLVFVFAVLDITGWIFNLHFLISLGPHWESMKLITALSFILYGLVMVSIVQNLNSVGINIFTIVIATLILLISLFSLYIYFHLFTTGQESSLTQMPFFRAFLSQNNRMALLASVCFLLLDFILFLLPRAKGLSDSITHILIIPVFLISFFTIVSYILGVPFATRFENVAIPFNTGLAFAGLCLVIALIRPGTWLMRFYNLPTLGGIISRRLLLPAILVPIIIGWLRIQGERSGLFESDQGVVIVAIIYSVCFLLMVWSTARYVNKLDLKRRESEETLRQSEERFRTIAETVPVLVCITRIEDSVVLFTNELNNKAFGFRGEDIIGTKGPDYYWNPSDRERMVKTFKERGVVSNFELKVKKSDGSPFWIMTSVRPITFKAQAAMIGASIDITESKKIEEALLISEERFRAIAENIPDLIVRFDQDLRLQYANPAAIKRTGLTVESLLGKTSLEYGAEPSSGVIWEKTAREVLSSGRSQRIELLNKWQGVTKVFDALIVPEIDLFGKVSSVISISRDVTEKKQSEDNIKASEDRFRTISESLTGIISITRISDALLTFVNEPFAEAFGFKKDKLLGKKYPDCFYYPNEFISIRDTLRAGGTIDNQEVKVRKSDGSAFWIMISVRKINFMNEPSYLSAAIDITESKKTQLELIRLNRILDAHSKSSQSMMHSNNEMSYINEVCKIIIEDCGHMMVWVGYAENDRRKHVKPVAYYGFDKGYIDQMDITWDETERGQGPTGTAIRTGNISMCKNMLTDPAFKPWRKAAIESGYASSIVLPLKSEGKPFGAISIYSKEPDPFSELEITLLSELADDMAYGISFIRLTESEREAARIIKESESKLKELVATKDKFFNIVAHDLKNPFTSLLGSSELLYNNIDQMSVENIRKLALILNDSAKGGYSILQNLLDWSRSETGLLKFNPENINLRIVVNESLDNVQLQVANKGISAISEVGEDFFIFTDKNMINTVLRNLISNAVKYTYKKGTVVVRAKKNAKECIITVKDSGIGIEKEKIETLFRLENSLSLPGTEKEQGTGLGLKLCKEFTERMGGRIWVESKDGKGSEFNFTIPLKR